MLKFIFFLTIFLLSSFETFAEGETYCPEKIEDDIEYCETPVSRHCCKNSVAYNPETKKYDRLCASYWGCPDDGKMVDFEGHGACGTCCKNGFGYNVETKKYDKIDSDCGCPDGGEQIVKFGTSHCCKNGYGLNYQEKNEVLYNQIDAHCGCPAFSSRMPYGDLCCKDGMGYNNKTKKFDIEANIIKDIEGYDEDCSLCPAGGYISPKDPNVCCKNGLKYRYAWTIRYGYIDEDPDLCPKYNKFVEFWKVITSP